MDKSEDFYLLRTNLVLQETVLVPHKAESEVTLDPGLRLPVANQRSVFGSRDLLLANQRPVLPRLGQVKLQ